MRLIAGIEPDAPVQVLDQLDGLPAHSDQDVAAAQARLVRR